MHLTFRMKDLKMQAREQSKPQLLWMFAPVCAVESETSRDNSTSEHLLAFESRAFICLLAFA